MATCGLVVQGFLNLYQRETFCIASTGDTTNIVIPRIEEQNDSTERQYLEAEKHKKTTIIFQ